MVSVKISPTEPPRPLWQCQKACQQSQSWRHCILDLQFFFNRVPYQRHLSNLNHCGCKWDPFMQYHKLGHCDAPLGETGRDPLRDTVTLQQWHSNNQTTAAKTDGYKLTGARTIWLRFMKLCMLCSGSGCALCMVMGGKPLTHHVQHPLQPLGACWKGTAVSGGNKFPKAPNSFFPPTWCLQIRSATCFPYEM